MWAIRLSTVALLVLFTGCDMNADKPLESLEQGKERARSYVEDTLKAAAAGYDVKPERRPDPGECNDGLGMGTGTFRDGYSVKIHLSDDRAANQLFEATSDYWQSKGYSISFENAERGEPVGEDAVVAVQLEEGYYGALELFPNQGDAYLGITTPCLPPAGEED